jgi:integrase
MKSGDVEQESVFSNPSTGKPYSDVKGSFKKACQKADITGLRFHDLRHTFASRLVESGADLITVKELLGHSTVKMTERYTHSNQTQKKNAVELLVNRAKKAPNVAQICHTEQQEENRDVVSSTN